MVQGSPCGCPGLTEQHSCRGRCFGQFALLPGLLAKVRVGPPQALA